MSEWVLEMLSPQGKAGERGLKGQKVRELQWAWMGTTSSQMPSPPAFPACSVPTLYSLPNPRLSKGLLSVCKSQEGSLLTAGSLVPSSILLLTGRCRESWRSWNTRHHGAARAVRRAWGSGPRGAKRRKGKSDRGQFVA